MGWLLPGEESLGTIHSIFKLITSSRAWHDSLLNFVIIFEILIVMSPLSLVISYTGMWWYQLLVHKILYFCDENIGFQTRHILPSEFPCVVESEYAITEITSQQFPLDIPVFIQLHQRLCRSMYLWWSSGSFSILLLELIITTNSTTSSNTGHVLVSYCYFHWLWSKDWASLLLKT